MRRTERLPAGLQVIGAPSSDARTLACAEWLLDRLGGGPSQP